jgi:protein-S-isoprenylcysteine O-methyltransferase Ste14
MVRSMSVAASVVTKRRNWWVRSRAWIAILIIAPFAVATVLSPPGALEGTWTDIEFDFAGWMLFMIGAAFRWWATFYIGGRKLDMVVADGPYSICRNPLYVGTFLMGIGIAFFLQSLTFAAGFGLAAVFYLGVTVPAEEILLREKFGQTFLDYCRKVPRYLPRLRNFQSPSRFPLNISGLRAEGLRSARWIWLPVLCEIVAHLRMEEWWPRLLHLP